MSSDLPTLQKPALPKGKIIREEGLSFIFLLVALLTIIVYAIQLIKIQF
jgi:hypothetical protein